MKRYMLLAVGMSLCLVVVSSLLSLAGAQVGVTVSIDAPATVDAGSDFIARVSVDDVAAFDGANYDISYDPDVIEPADITGGYIAGTEIPVDAWRIVAPGTLRVLQNIPGVPGVSGSGHLAEIHYRVVGQAGTASEISFSNGIMGDAHANAVPATWVGAWVSVQGSEPESAMWVDAIAFAPYGKHVTIRVKVAEPDPVVGALVGLSLDMDGAPVAVFSGYTNNKSGEASFRVRHVANGEYVATVTSLAHERYVWDMSQGTYTAQYVVGE